MRGFPVVPEESERGSTDEDDRGCLNWKDWWGCVRMFPPKPKKAPEPYEDGDYAILFRWFYTARHHEQAHNDQAMSHKKTSKRFTYLIVLLNAFASLFANWPWPKEFEESGSLGGLSRCGCARRRRRGGTRTATCRTTST